MEINFKKLLDIYITGSQGVAAEHFCHQCNNINELTEDIMLIIDDHCQEYIENYIDDADGDADDALNEAVADCGTVYIGYWGVEYSCYEDYPFLYCCGRVEDNK